jgi:2'-5' RNA ligase
VTDERVERLRLFVALSLPKEVRAEIEGWREAALGGRRELRLSELATLHATLCFLGWQPAEEVGGIAAACLAVAGSGAARSRLGAAIWLPRRRPNVLALELEALDGALAEVQAAVARELERGGWYRPEARPYLPHVTVARLRRGSRVLREAVAAPPAVEFAAVEVTLYRSLLAQGGARYEALASVDLGARAG